MEEEAQEAEQKLLVASKIPPAAKLRDNRVFFDGTPEDQNVWLSALQTELAAMDTQKKVYTRFRRSERRTTLGLKEHEPWPEIIPTRLVVTEKPDVTAPTAEKHSAKTAAEEAAQAWISRVRLCACGNFESEATKGDSEFTSNNLELKLSACIFQRQRSGEFGVLVHLTSLAHS